MISAPSPAPLTRGLLHFDLITINASFCPLPLPISCLVWETLRFWISSFFPTLYYQKSRARSFSLGMDLSFHRLLLRLPSLFQLYFTHSRRTTPSLLLSVESSHSLSHPRSCVAVWVIQVIMVNKCAISMETSLWSGTSSVSAFLHAAVLNRWRDIFVCMIEIQ